LLSALPAHADKYTKVPTKPSTTTSAVDLREIDPDTLLDWCPATDSTGVWEESSLASALQRFNAYDYDGDDTDEINSVSVLIPPVSKAGSAHRYVVMLVDARYIETMKWSSQVPRMMGTSGWAIDTSELLSMTDLEDWATQLVAEGYAPIVLSTDIFGTDATETGNDARTTLAVRELLRYLYDCASDSAKPNRLEGVVLTGAFPEPAVMNLHWNATAHRLLPEPQTLSGAVVYGDMDGKWEDTLISSEERLRYNFDFTDDSVQSGDVLDESLGLTLTNVTVAEETLVTLNDGFLISDADIEVTDAPSGVEGHKNVHLTLDVNRELSDSDKMHAVPELKVSRLDPSTVSFDPWNADGLSFDIPGVEIGMRLNGSRIWIHEPLRELQMLKDYFDRNLSYRQGRDITSDAVLSIAADGLSQHNRTVPQFIADNGLDEHPDSLDDGATLSDAVAMLSADARYKFVIAHSSPHGSAFEHAYESEDGVPVSAEDEAFHTEEMEALAAAFPDGVWRWTDQGSALSAMDTPRGEGWRSSGHVVSDSDVLSRGLELDLLRTHYEQSRAKLGPAAFYFHGGCNYASPGNMTQHVSTEGTYGAGQRIPGDRGFKQSSALLFFGNGLTVHARAKVFNDGAADYLDMLDGKSSIGDLWLAGFVAGSQDTSEVYHDELSKRQAYNWSQEGDWTLPFGL
jgi:hypothetical protein